MDWVTLLSQQGGPNLDVTQLRDRGSMSIAPGQTIPVVISLQEDESQEHIECTDAVGSILIAPGQTIPVVISLQEDESQENIECTDAVLTLKISASEGQNQELPVTLKCRKRKESFLFTFLDHDGSVQSAAAIEPLENCPEGSCPVLLSLHGTGVEAQNQADSYKRMEEGQWFFGLEKAWVLTPTRHGAHNWEGPGALTPMTALETLQKITEEMSWIPNKADSRRVIFAGHSMGGHGAWHLATHYPDRAIGVISLAGWIKKEEYGDSNVFFRHDISTSHTDPAVKAIMEACIAENDADRHVSNLKGIPVLTRIGAQDRTVHPFYVRRMYRLLQEVGVNVTYTELAGKEHWWWDTWTTNDGGAVNDPQLRNFANQIAEDAPSYASGSCDAEGLDCSQPNYALKYSGIENLEKSGKWTLTVVNPAFGEGLLGVRILQQSVPFRTSKVEMEFPDRTHAELRTVNVDRFSLNPSHRVQPSWSHRTIKVDETILDLEDGSVNAGARIHVCKLKGKWQVCVEETLLGIDQRRSPVNFGPARRVAEHQFVIIYGTQDKSLSQSLLTMAVYIANLFYLTSDTIAPIFDDETLTEDKADSHNLIVIGGPHQNQWTQRFLDKVPLSLGDSGISLGDCTFSGSGLGALFLAPHRDNGLALVLLGTTTQGLEDTIRLASPTIPPMTRSPFSNMIPDFVLTGRDFQAKGSGGYLCTGFWGNQWEFRRELSSCAC
ncbi:uncharacterized protein [Amphiura filiformis]|uniref:uncharacterized protein n=1 Tax=Amphiura filiformis TaxID=82378 RepID=UPI003B221ECE